MSGYTPTVTQGIYPDDGGWTKENDTNVLLLSVPMLSTIMTIRIDMFDYIWLYDVELDAYIFCFRIQNEEEFALLFQKEHAGRLLVEDEATGEFSIIITDQPFENLTDESPYITLSNISLERQTIAGW